MTLIRRKSSCVGWLNWLSDSDGSPDTHSWNKQGIRIKLNPPRTFEMVQMLGSSSIWEIFFLAWSTSQSFLLVILLSRVPKHRMGQRNGAPFSFQPCYMLGWFINCYLQLSVKENAACLWPSIPSGQAVWVVCLPPWAV